MSQVEHWVGDVEQVLQVLSQATQVVLPEGVNVLVGQVATQTPLYK